MKVLHYVGSFSMPSETFIYDLINNLEDNGVNNYVLTHTRVLEDERPFSKVKIISEKVSFIKKVYFKLFKSWQIRNFQDVYKYINELQPDIIHTHFGSNGVKIFNLLIKYKLDIPLIVSFHGMDINVLPKKNKAYTNFLLKLNSCDNILFTSPSSFLKRKMLTIGLNKNKIEIIPSAYNNIFEKVQKKSFWKKGETLKILSIGRFEEVKGQKYLIKAFAQVLKIYPKATLTFIGYGSLETELRNLCKKLNIEEMVIFLNQVEHHKLPNLIIKHDLYIQPSIIAKDGAEESLSVSTIEAQVCGLASIVSKIGGLKEIVIDDVTGKFSLNKDIDSLVKSIVFYLDNDVIKEHSNNAKFEARKRFNKNIIVKKTKGLYENF